MRMPCGRGVSAGCLRWKGLEVNDLLILLGCVAAFAVIMMLVHRANKKRMAGLEAMLREKGFAATWGKDAAEKALSAGVMNFIGPFRTLRTGEKGVSWFALGMAEDRRCIVLEHRYTSGSGKNTSTHYHTIAAVEAPERWPVLSLTGEAFFHKIGEKMGIRDIKVEDEEFNKRFRVKCDDEDFAVLVLTPEMQAWLKLLPKRVEVSIGDGAVCVVKRWVCKAEDVATMIAAAGALRNMLPAELESYNTREMTRPRAEQKALDSEGDEELDHEELDELEEVEPVDDESGEGKPGDGHGGERT